MVEVCQAQGIGLPYGIIMEVLWLLSWSGTCTPWSWVQYYEGNMATIVEWLFGLPGSNIILVDLIQ
jgi:hypothetical protein